MMEKFINNHQYNKIAILMQDYQRLLKFSSDKVIVDATKVITNSKIAELFNECSEDEQFLIDISLINKPDDVEQYLGKLETMTYGMKPVSENQIKKLFRKEKKLKIPVLDFEMKSFYGWFDQGKRKLYLMHYLEGKLSGMVCQVKDTEVSNSRMCAICGHMNEGREVVPVSVKCKTSSPDSYHVIGFNVCKDSDACNKRVTDLEPLENLLIKVNKG